MMMMMMEGSKETRNIRAQRGNKREGEEKKNEQGVGGPFFICAY
jgi:hypothetical protein